MGTGQCLTGGAHRVLIARGGFVTDASEGGHGAVVVGRVAVVVHVALRCRSMAVHRTVYPWMMASTDAVLLAGRHTPWGALST